MDFPKPHHIEPTNIGFLFPAAFVVIVLELLLGLLSFIDTLLIQSDPLLEQIQNLLIDFFDLPDDVFYCHHAPRIYRAL